MRITGVEHISCKAARTVTGECITSYTVHGWSAHVARTNVQEITLTNGRMVIQLRGIAGGAPRCAGAASKATQEVVLGSAAFAGSIGVGWGTMHPSEIFNGGDPSGMVSRIQWTSWGGATANGDGSTSIFKPGGGYYDELVPAQLHAYDLGRCTAHGPLAYRRLSVREPSRPGGPFGKWGSWSGSKTLCQFGF